MSPKPRHIPTAEVPEQVVARGPASRPHVSSHLFDALLDQYGIGDRGGARDLGGSSNLNLLLTDTVSGHRYVVRVYRPWVTASRLADMQLVRRHLALGGVPCAQPIRTIKGEAWTVVDDRLVEVEPYVGHNAKMDSWQRRWHQMLGGHSSLFGISVGGSPRSPEVETKNGDAQPSMEMLSGAETSWRGRVDTSLCR